MYKGSILDSLFYHLPMEKGYTMLTYHDMKNNEEIKTYIARGNDVLGEVGYTEHGFAHATRTALWAKEILTRLGYSPRQCELAAIAGYLHDIGNVINRVNHAQNGGAMAFELLHRLGMEADEICTIVSAIGHHDETAAAPVNPASAALILADKSDVRRSRVRDKTQFALDIHDRVNYAATSSSLSVDAQRRLAMLDITIDTEICAVMEYFEIFLTRMLLCRKAAEYLNLKFELVINNIRLL